MDPENIKQLEEEFGTGKVSLGAFIAALNEVTEALGNVGGGGGPPPDLSTIENLLTEIRDQLITIRNRQTQTRNAARETRNELRLQTPILEQIEANTRRGGPRR